MNELRQCHSRVQPYHGTKMPSRASPRFFWSLHSGYYTAWLHGVCLYYYTVVPTVTKCLPTLPGLRLMRAQSLDFSAACWPPAFVLPYNFQ